MNNKQEIEKLTEATLNSLNNLQHVEANEFLYAKVINRMRTNELKERVVYTRLMIKLSVALGLFICVNGVSYYLFERQSKGKTEVKITKSGAAAFAEEYSLNANSYNY